MKLAKVTIDRGSEVDTPSCIIIDEACYAQVLKSKNQFEGLAALQNHTSRRSYLPLIVIPS
jgi:methylglutaconyl-CoA hydratase